PETLADAVDAFMSAKRHKSRKTRDGYLWTLGRFMDFVGPKKMVSTVTADDVHRWLDSTNTGDVSKKTYTRTLKVFFRWAKQEGITDTVVTEKVKLRKVQNKFPKSLNREEVDTLVSTIREKARGAKWLA